MRMCRMGITGPSGCRRRPRATTRRSSAPHRRLADFLDQRYELEPRRGSDLAPRSSGTRCTPSSSTRCSVSRSRCRSRPTRRRSRRTSISYRSAPRSPRCWCRRRSARADRLPECVDRKPGQTSDERAIDPDVLEVGPQQQLELLGGARHVPMRDRAGDQGVDVAAEHGHGPVHGGFDRRLDPHVQGRVAADSSGQVGHGVDDPLLDRRTRRAQLGPEPVEGRVRTTSRSCRRSAGPGARLVAAGVSGRRGQGRAPADRPAAASHSRTCARRRRVRTVTLDLVQRDDRPAHQAFEQSALHGFGQPPGSLAGEDRFEVGRVVLEGAPHRDARGVDDVVEHRARACGTNQGRAHRYDRRPRDDRAASPEPRSR